MIEALQNHLNRLNQYAKLNLPPATDDKSAEKIVLAYLRSTRVPSHMHYGFVDYIVKGFRPGSFLEAVLRNDLLGAVYAADSVNRNQLPSIATAVDTLVPYAAKGSHEAIQAWIQAHAPQ